MLDVPAVVALRDHIAASPRLDDALYDAVCAVVDHLKSVGWSPERVIVAVKQIADDAGLRPTRAVLSASQMPTEGDILLIRMVEWCIERYYGSEPGPAQRRITH